MLIEFGPLAVKTRVLSGLIVSFSLLVGCTAVPSVPNESLTDFSASIATLKKDTDDSFSDITVASEARFKANLLEELGDGDTYSLDKLDIETDLKTLTVKKVPYFLKLQKLKAEVSQLNGALVDYVDLLAKLADPETISTVRFDSLATHLNNNVLGVGSAVKSEAKKAETGLFSLTAMALTKNYLQSKQAEGLVAVIRSNQPTVLNFAQRLQKAVLIIARAVNVEYIHETKALKLNVAKATNKTTDVDVLIARNKKHFTDLQTLKRLHTNYGRLPLIHSEVADVILAGNGSAPKIMRMLEETSKLKADYDKTMTPTSVPVVPVNTPIQ